MAQQVALVTGATRGIGREVAAQLGQLGFTVLLSGRSDAEASSVASDLAAGEPGVDIRSLGVDLDVSDPSSVARLPDAVRRAGEGLDVLVNNAAAFVDWGELGSDADLALAHSVMETNLFGAWRVTQALLPLLRESAHARIVNVSSGAGSHGDEAFGLARRGGRAASYGVSKAALGALTSTLAAELDGSGILVNAVCPGLTATWPGAEQMGARPVTDGAASVVLAATLPDGGPSGGFFRDGRPIDW